MSENKQGRKNFRPRCFLDHAPQNYPPAPSPTPIMKGSLSFLASLLPHTVPETFKFPLNTSVCISVLVLGVMPSMEASFGVTSALPFFIVALLLLPLLLPTKPPTEEVEEVEVEETLPVA